MSEDIDIFKSKFEGVFPASQIEDLLNEYHNLIENLKNLIEFNKGNDFNLSHDIVNIIFEKTDEIENYCTVSNEFSLIRITLNFTYKGINRFKIIKLKKKEYKFFFKNNYYYCFDIDSLRDHLKDLFLHYKYYIEFQIFPFSERKTNDIEAFLMLGLSEFKISIEYQYKDIDYSSFNYNSIYNLPKIITGEALNLKLGHYVSLTEDDFKEFVYYDTNERQQFFKGLKYIVNYKRVFGLCGPYGTGKTITLLKTIISDYNKKYLYINLGTVYELDNDELKKLLEYEIIKLFDKNVINFKGEKLEEKNAYDKIINLIKNFKDKNIFQLLKNIILEMNKIKYADSYFIIDQYSSKYDINNENIQELIAVNKNNHIIICSSMNNESVKYSLYKCLNQKTLLPIYNIDFIYFFYVGSLIRLNKVTDTKELIIKNSPEFIKYLQYFGFIPLYYYLLKRAQKERGELDDFVDKEKESIMKEIKLFYKNNKKIKNEESIQMILDILDIMNFINRREIFFFDELSEAVLKLPLKFLELKKENIKINDLKLFGLASKNQKIEKYIEKLEEKNTGLNKKDDEIISNKYIIFFNEDRCCYNYISKLSEKEKKKLNFTYTNIEEDTTIYYLDYLFPLMEEIFSFLTYEIISKSSEYLFAKLSGQTQGGLLELIISEHIKKKKMFLLYNISYFETIDNFVPNEFFIQNYVTRETNTLRTFIENKYNNYYEKKKLPSGNIFFTQSQFTGKYYDCALLVQIENSSEYILMLFQISKRKITSHRYFREEHMIIFNRVKSKLEKEYDIIIKEGHFSYILLYEEQDKETINFCKNYNLNYFLFSINKLSFMEVNNIIFTEKTLITKQFPIQSSFSILPGKTFEMSKKQLTKYEFIKNFQQQLIYENIEENLKNLINQFFETNHDLAKGDENEFYLFGNFDEIIPVNNSFCIWFNNDELSLYYNKNKEYKKLSPKHSSKLSGKKFSLICSKYSIKQKDI